MRTERLEFRSWSPGDFELALALWGDPDVTRLFALGAKGLFAGHHPENHASRGLLKKLGFRYTQDHYFAPTGRQHLGYLLNAEEHALTVPRA